MHKILLDRPLVEANWLKDHLAAPNLIIIDATLPKAVAKDAGAKLVEEQIPHARFLDIQTKFSKTDAIYPNTMLEEDDFNRASRDLGIDHDSAIVVYDDHGIYSSARAWWMFRSMGHRNVAVLNGGLKNWLELGYPTEKKTAPKTYKGNFTGTYAGQFFKDHQQVLDHISNKDAQVVDARANDRFQGLVEEPRKGLRSGHIPTSVNLPYTDLLKDEKMLEPKALKAIFNERLPEHKNLVFSCGSGITACVLALGAELAGFTNSSVYDGSWTEWGSIPELPIEKGEG
jgi:thiosulfate/3-mercaptopyruvate sulfurtransferase